MQELCFWLRMTKDNSRHGVGVGRHGQGLSLLSEFVWDRKVVVEEEMESGWTPSSLRVGGTRMEQRAKDTFCPEV